MGKIRGTVATRVKNGRAVTSPLKVMREYLGWGLTPTYWSDARAHELAVTMQWALKKIPKKIKTKQDRIENAEK